MSPNFENVNLGVLLLIHTYENLLWKKSILRYLGTVIRDSKKLHKSGIFLGIDIQELNPILSHFITTFCITTIFCSLVQHSYLNYRNNKWQSLFLVFMVHIK